MFDNTTNPTSELLDDLRDGREDVRVCQLALGNGIEAFRDTNVRERLRINLSINAKIEAELSRRGVVEGAK